MNIRTRLIRSSLGLSFAVGLAVVAGCSTMTTMKTWVGLGQKLSGNEEVPATKTLASGKADISISEDRSVSGNVYVSDMKPTAAHIHEGAPGKNGPVVLGLNKTSDNSFAVPPNAKLTEAQFKAFKAGNLYINVHSGVYPNGEVRAQLKP